MTHTSTEQPEALRLAELIETGNRRSGDSAIAAELRRLHARVQELEAQTAHMADLVELADYATKKLEASQAQRVPLTASQVAELLDEAGYSIWDMTRADFINGIRHGERAHGITQEKQR